MTSQPTVLLTVTNHTMRAVVEALHDAKSVLYSADPTPDVLKVRSDIDGALANIRFDVLGERGGFTPDISAWLTYEMEQAVADEDGR